MKFEFSATIDGPLARVEPLLRDRLPELVPFLLTVKAIELLERTTPNPGEIYMLRLWEGNRKMMPPIARPFVTRSMRLWKDHAHWFEEDLRIEWRFEPFRFKKLFTCSGTNYIDDLGDDTTRVRMTGELVVHATRVPGIGMRLAKRLAPRIERWIIATIEPNLLQVPHAVQALFEAERKATTVVPDLAEGDPSTP